jgi:hypothetical protein
VDESAQPEHGAGLKAAERLEAIRRELDGLIPENEVIVFSREGYSLKQINVLEREIEKLREALGFYADPMTYFGIAILPDQPAGEFCDDIDEVPWPDGGTNHKPGRRARETLRELYGTA